MESKINKTELEQLGKELEIPSQFLSLSLSHINIVNDDLFSLACSLADFNKGASAFSALSEKIKDDPNGEKMFLCYLIGLSLTKKSFLDKEIPLCDFHNSMSSIAECIENEYKDNGVYKYTAAWWQHRHVSSRMYRIGELEFELYDDENDHVISIHIPPKSNLSNDCIDLTLKQAREFMRRYFPSYYKLKWTTYSWLVDPNLTRLLPESSKIKQFSDRFEVVNRSDNLHEILQWVFKINECNDFKTLPENTSLQRLIKKELIKGNTFGVAFAILKKENN